MSKYILYRYQFSPIQSNVQSMFPVEAENMSDEELMQRHKFYLHPYLMKMSN